MYNREELLKKEFDNFQNSIGMENSFSSYLNFMGIFFNNKIVQKEYKSIYEHYIFQKMQYDSRMTDINFPDKNSLYRFIELIYRPNGALKNRKGFLGDVKTISIKKEYDGGCIIYINKDRQCTPIRQKSIIKEDAWWKILIQLAESDSHSISIEESTGEKISKYLNGNPRNRIYSRGYNKTEILRYGNGLMTAVIDIKIVKK